MRYDCVITSDHHPMLCGTAKFSHQLAERLGVPCETVVGLTRYSLVSVRASEMRFHAFTPQRFDLFLHDWDVDEAQRTNALTWLRRAGRVFAANRSIADQIRPLRHDVTALWAPSTIQGNPHRGAINVLTFGMAHKIQAHHYEKLKTLLDGTGEDYTVSVSTAIHEGSPWDETARVADRLRVVFGDHLRVLGYLSDDALARELRDCSGAAIFFDPALRANNTTAYAVLDANKALITNKDGHSPRFGLDIDGLSLAVFARMCHANGFATVSPDRKTWENLLAVMHAEVPCAS